MKSESLPTPSAFSISLRDYTLSRTQIENLIFEFCGKPLELIDEDKVHAEFLSPRDLAAFQSALVCFTKLSPSSQS